MFYPSQVFDQATQTNLTVYCLYEQFQALFTGLFQVLNDLRSTVNAKWTPEQTQAYQKCLTDIYEYVATFIWTMNPQCWYYEHFSNAMIQYADVNPVGF